MARDIELKKAIQNLEKDIRSLRKDLHLRLHPLPKQIDNLQKDATRHLEKTVTERPLLALGVAFALGMAFGIALSASRSR